MLKCQRHQVRHAADGATAVELAANQQPDLVILDIGLPGMSGYVVAEKLRQDLHYQDTLIIAVTGYGQERDRERSRQAGIDHHLVKPVDYETLAILTREWLRTASGRRRRPWKELPNCSSQSQSHCARILVVDDTRPIAQIAQHMLRSQGHEVEIAFDGPAAITVAKRFRPDLVLCDLSLPGMSGYDLLRVLRTEPALGSTLFVAVTGYSDEEDKRRTAEAGFHAHLVKPVSLESLQEILRLLPKSAGVSP